MLGGLLFWASFCHVCHFYPIVFIKSNSRVFFALNFMQEIFQRNKVVNLHNHTAHINIYTLVFINIYILVICNCVSTLANVIRIIFAVPRDSIQNVCPFIQVFNSLTPSEL